ncbi:MAG: GTPase HflX [Candidatus Omnitrophica bacterium]|nr:GTPase HflX [Candidatus Omnitrophota bacterium]
MERTLLINIRLTDRTYRDSWPIEESARELEELARSSGLDVREQVTLQKDRPTPNLFIGKGKAQEIHDRSHELKTEVVVFGEDLSSPQQRNLEDLIGLKVIDRTQLILDIFARRARSEEGKVQVELAQLQYLLPRLAGKGILLSRLGGGIGTRGPGEQKLEMDRRRIRLRIGRLKKELDLIHRRRDLARRKREEEEIPTVALIGYTNVGKTTLLNRLTQAGAVARDQLFTTLDPVARRLTLANHQQVLLSDTVGFLHRLPHHLIDAFQATLEEVTQSHLLLHVQDASSLMLEEQAAAVREVLQRLHAEKKSFLSVFNKIDRLDSPSLGSLRRRHPEALFISAVTGEGIPDLRNRLIASLMSSLRPAVVRLPQGDQHWLGAIYAQGQVLRSRPMDSDLLLECRIPQRLYGQLAKAGLLYLS